MRIRIGIASRSPSRGLFPPSKSRNRLNLMESRCGFWEALQPLIVFALEKGPFEIKLLCCESRRRFARVPAAMAVLGLGLIKNVYSLIVVCLRKTSFHDSGGKYVCRKRKFCRTKKKKKMFDLSLDLCTVMICLCACASGSTAWERAVCASAPSPRHSSRTGQGAERERSLVSSY